MARNSQRPEGAQVAAVAQRNQREWDYNEQNRLLVDMPPKEERGIAAERDGTDEVWPCGVEEELDEWDGLGNQRQDERHSRRDLREHRKGCITNEAAGDAINSFLVD